MKYLVILGLITLAIVFAVEDSPDYEKFLNEKLPIFNNKSGLSYKLAEIYKIIIGSAPDDLYPVPAIFTKLEVAKDVFQNCTIGIAPYKPERNLKRKLYYVNVGCNGDVWGRTYVV